MKHRSKLYDISKEELQHLCDSSNSKAEILTKLHMSCHGGNHSTLSKVLDEKEIDLTQLKENREKAQIDILNNNKHTLPLEQIIYSKIDFRYSSCKLKQRLIKEGYKKYQCENCLNTEWLGNPIPLQLHHKDGNHNNNYIENLQILCPNCHSLTSTFAGKKLKLETTKSKNNDRNHIKQEKVRKKGLNEDGDKLYDGYGNYKIICPICNNNFKNREATMCRWCYSTIQNIPKIPKDELRKYVLEDMSYIQIGKKYGMRHETIRKYLKYYAENDPIEDIPDREILKNKIRNKSIDEICTEYNISLSIARRWFKLQGIPYSKHSIEQIADEKWAMI